MLIACPSCATTYQIELAALGPAGRSVRCSHCRNTWFATQGEALATTAAAVQADAAAAPPPQPEPPADAASSDEAADGTWVVVDNPPAPEPAAPDALVTVLDDAPPIAPDDAANPPTLEQSVPDAIETIAARRARRIEAGRRSRPDVLRRLASVPMLIVALLAILGASVQWRASLVRHMPQTASLFAAIGLPVNLRGLIFDNVKSVTEPQDGMPVLVIEGTIINVTPRTLELPRLRFALRNAAGQEIYAWTSLPAKPQLGSGDGLAFRTRLASPPAEGRDVVVRFFNRRDVTAGLQ